MDIHPKAEEAVNAALAAHNKVRRFELESEAHGVVMLLADLVDYADASTPPLDLGALLDEAREMAISGRD